MQPWATMPSFVRCGSARCWCLSPFPVMTGAEADHGPGAPRLWVRTCARQTVLAFSPETVALVDASGRPVVSSSSIQSVSFVGSALHS